ncbi:MAG: hypothetical protein WBM48_14920 [Polyangiales bacterium]
MIQHYIVGVGSLLLLSVVWLVVQRAWKKSFADLADQPDALSGRSRCHGCSDSEACGAQEKTS